MTLSFSPVENFIAKIVNRESDPINRARIRMLLYIIFAYSCFAFVLIVAYTYTKQPLQLIRSFIILLVSVLLIGIMHRRNVWRCISHTVLMLLTILGVWGNLLVYVHGVNAATLQYIWMASALGFYMHGSKWGWFYSLANVTPVLIDAIVIHKDSFLITSTPQIIDTSIYVFVLIFDFFIIIFLHYFFFKAFNENFQTLTRTKNELNDSNDRLNATLKDIKKFSNARMEFLSIMSHEVRTPLNGVIGLTGALLEQKPREDQEEMLSVLRFSAENLLVLINDILDFNKLDSGKVELEKTPFDLESLIKNIYASIKIRAEEKNLLFDLRISENLVGKVVHGDPTRLTQVLLNLLSNAIKFTSSGFVNLFCTVIYENETEIAVRFAVEDSGIGIEESKKAFVFEAFTQASASTNRNYGGTGLGLSIVKKVLDLYGSAIEMESELDEGTKLGFTIVFPLNEAEAVKDKLEKRTISDLSDLKILVAEDNMVNVLVVQKTLQRHSIEPDIAGNGRQVLELLSQKDYDVILMDLYMPEMDGYHTTMAIRNLKDHKKANIPIVALTATVDSNVKRNVLEVGMNDYLSKPFRAEDLFSKLELLMERN